MTKGSPLKAAAAGRWETLCARKQERWTREKLKKKMRFP
jgi:hypothetical protein